MFDRPHAYFQTPFDHAYTGCDDTEPVGSDGSRYKDHPPGSELDVLDITPSTQRESFGMMGIEYGDYILTPNEREKRARVEKAKKIAAQSIGKTANLEKRVDREQPIEELIRTGMGKFPGPQP